MRPPYEGCENLIRLVFLQKVDGAYPTSLTLRDKLANNGPIKPM